MKSASFKIPGGAERLVLGKMESSESILQHKYVFLEKLHIHIAFYWERANILKTSHDKDAMLPLILDLRKRKILLIGEGAFLLKRLKLLDAASPLPSGVDVYSRKPSLEIRKLAGARLKENLPNHEQMTGKIIFIAGLSEKDSANLAKKAKEAGALLNVEDMPHLCDFHVPSILRRGDIIFTVSTGGKSPTLAKSLRERIAKRYGPEWAGRLEQISSAREAWRQKGFSPDKVGEKSRQMIEAEKWLS